MLENAAKTPLRPWQGRERGLAVPQMGGKGGGQAKHAGGQLNRLRRTPKGQGQRGMGPGGRNQGPEKK